MKKCILSLVVMLSLNSASVLAADSSGWQGSGSAAFALSSGNTKYSSLNLGLNLAKASSEDKWSFAAQSLRSSNKTNGTNQTTAELWRLTGRYDRNISGDLFAFSGLEFEHDKLKSLDLRSVFSLGAGYHVFKQADHTLDLFAGLSIRNDKYKDPGVIFGNDLKTKYTATELMFGEECTRKLNDQVSLKHKLVIYPNLKDGGKYRAILDAGVAVAINKVMSLSVSVQDRYDNQVSSGVKKNDILFLTGITYAIGN